MKHPTKVEKYSGSLEELARDIVNMRYDSLAELLGYIEKNLIEDYRNDMKRGREQLSNKLKKAAVEIFFAKGIIDSAWKICKEHMKE